MCQAFGKCSIRAIIKLNIKMNKYINLFICRAYKNKLLYHFYCSLSQDKNFSKDKDSIAMGIELCNIPHISEH